MLTRDKRTRIPLTASAVDRSQPEDVTMRPMMTVGSAWGRHVGGPFYYHPSPTARWRPISDEDGAQPGGR